MPWKIKSFLRRNHATNLQNTIQTTPGTKPKNKSKTVKKNPKTILHPLKMIIEIVDLPNKNDDFPVRYAGLPEGNIYHVFLAMRAKIDQVRGMIGP
jgi:hypothetical protein